MSGKQRFDDWPERYDRWFETPVGKAVLKYETGLILEMLLPGRGERILDAGSGTGLFTREFLALGAKVVGLDISIAMLVYAAQKGAIRQERGDQSPTSSAAEQAGYRQSPGGNSPMPVAAGQKSLRQASDGRDPMSVLVDEKAALRQAPDDRGSMRLCSGEKGQPLHYRGVTADMTTLPFADGSFDKSVSVTALEFVADEKRAVAELFRVTRPGGVVVVATLNSLSSWAAGRSENARRDPKSIFSRVFFRSPAQLLAATSVPGIVRTVVHFGKEDDPATFDRSEREGEGRETGAFVAARWLKP
ncbi:MAG: methyltransferase domain-containing protein [Proteobacteria bacterium]|nr:methyltransferase domain-containing protein [Pseudomonadota bacterium]